MLLLRAATFAYAGSSPVLRNITADFGPGLTLLVGPNGCGKTTLLRLLAGVERPDEGTVSIDGQDLWGDEVAARLALAYLPEYPDVTPYASVGEVLLLVARLRHQPTERARSLLRVVALDTLSHRSIRELSFGQRRRVLLAATMLGNPAHLLLDEPLEGLDQAIRRETLAWLEERLDAGVCAVLAAHDVQVFLGRASRAATIRAGRLEISDALPADLDERKHFLDRFSRG